MSFIRTKFIHGAHRAYLVESRRVRGKVRQKVLAYLGRVDPACATIEGVITECEREIAALREEKKRLAAEMALAREELKAIKDAMPPYRRWGCRNPDRAGVRWRQLHGDYVRAHERLMGLKERQRMLPSEVARVRRRLARARALQS